MSDARSDADLINEVVLTYCRAVDRMDVAGLRACYHPDAVDHHTGFDGSVADYVDWVTVALTRFDGTMHLVGNHLAQIEGARAVAETYGMAVHWGSPHSDPSRNFTSGFRYVDRMQRRDGRWAISERWAVREWTHDDSGRVIAPEGAGPRGRRDSGDPLYRALAWL